MVKTYHKNISIKKFAKLWENVKNEDGDAIFPNLALKIKDMWKWQLRVAFNMAKKRNSWGPMTSPFLIELARTFQVPERSEGYSNVTYVKNFPDTYKKTGELFSKIKGDSPYVLKNFSGKKQGGLKIRAPLKSLNIRLQTPYSYKVRKYQVDHVYTYRWLEEKRSYIKGAFLHAWPDIFEMVVDMIGK